MADQPCCEDCPAVTGSPSGRIQFCPRQEPARHRRGSAFGPEWRRQGDQWEQLDWRTGKWVPSGAGEQVVPLHPNYTDCCADFGCCAGEDPNAR